MPDYQQISAGRRARDKALREKRVRCEVVTQYGTRCTANGDATFGRVLCWVHRQVHMAGRPLELVRPDGAMLRTLLDPNATTKAQR